MAKSKLQDIKRVLVIAPQAIKDDTLFVGSVGSTPVSVDTKGFSELEFLITTGATDIAHAILKVYESDDDSSYTAVPGGDFSVAPLTLPSSTDDNTMSSVFIELDGKRKRYFQIEAKAGNGTLGSFVTVHALLTRAVETPNTASERGLSQQALIP